MTEATTKSVRCRAAMVARVATLVSTLAALLMLAGCGESAGAGNADGSEAGDRQPAAERGTDRQTSDNRNTETEKEANEHSTDTEGRAGEEKEAPGADAAEKATNASLGSMDASREVILEIEGNEARFTGTCSVGGEERRLDGRTPERYAFSPDDGKLQCEIRGEGPGTLNVVLAAGNDVRSVQQSGAGGSKVSLTYTEDRISINQSSSGSGRQVQSTSVSGVSSRDTSAP